MTSLRAARLTTSPPRQASRKAKNAAFPHWPGETQTPPVASIVATMPKLVGLKTCLPRTRSANLPAMVTAAASAASAAELVRNSRQSDSPEIRALRGSKAGSRQTRVQAYWVSRATASRRSARPGGISRSRRVTP